MPIKTRCLWGSRPVTIHSGPQNPVNSSEVMTSARDEEGFKSSFPFFLHFRSDTHRWIDTTCTFTLTFFLFCGRRY
ncbi:hypothetical protein SRHO_G00191240 [Serrasalmus rhombeus]